MDGVLSSWAVPEGSVDDTADKRLAVQVEDHPLEYGDFEGVIPRRQLRRGRGDRLGPRQWVPLEDSDEGLKKGKLLFELRGYKLRGKWTLVKIKKQREGVAADQGARRVRRIAGRRVPPRLGAVGPHGRGGQGAAKTARAELAARLEQAGAPRARVDAAIGRSRCSPSRRRSRSRARLAVRAQARRLSTDRRASATARRSCSRATATTTPHVSRRSRAPSRRCRSTAASSTAKSWCSTREGKPSFSRLQQRGALSRARSTSSARRSSCRRRSSPSICSRSRISTCARCRSRSARGCCSTLLPEARRRALLRSHRARGRGDARAGRARSASRASSPSGPTRRTRAGARSDWLKIKRRADRRLRHRRLSRRPKDGAQRLRRAAARRLRGRRARYAGRVGTGFESARARRLLEPRRSRRSSRAEPPCRGARPRSAARRRGSSRVSCARCASASGRRTALLRQPAFLRLRDDKIAARLRSAGWRRSATARREPRGRRAAPSRTRRRPRERADAASTFSNLEKVYWPADGYTKGDLIEYYRAISPWMLPYLRDRPLVLTRFPDGIDGKSFYQKDAPEFAPELDAHEPIWSEDTQREIRYFVLRRRRVAALRREHRLDPAAHLGEPRRVARAARLVRDRSRSQGGAVLRRDHASRARIHALCETIGCRTT